jgi:hypothetical protein
MVEARAWRLRRRESRPPRTQGLRRLRTQRPRKTPAASSARPGCPISPAPWRMARGSARARHVCAHRAPREGEAPRGGELARIGPEEVRERYGVDPKQVPDFIALRGDPSDKLPGAPGVGPKRAAQLLRRYGTLDAVLGADPFTCTPKVVTTVGTHKAIPRAKRPPIPWVAGGGARFRFRSRGVVGGAKTISWQEKGPPGISQTRSNAGRRSERRRRAQLVTPHDLCRAPPNRSRCALAEPCLRGRQTAATMDARLRAILADAGGYQVKRWRRRLAALCDSRRSQALQNQGPSSSISKVREQRR